MKIHRKILILTLFLTWSFSYAQNPSLVVQTGHSGTITGMDISSDGKFLATSSGADHTTIIWDVLSGRQFRTINTGYQGVANIVFSPDDKFIWGVAGMDSIKKWNIYTGEVEQVLAPSSLGMTYCLDVSSDGKYLASVSVGIAIYDLEKGEEVSATRLNTLAQVAKFSPDGKYLATSGIMPEVDLWDPTTLEPVKSFTGMMKVPGSLKNLEFSRDGKWIATNNMNQLRIWEVESEKEVASINVPTIYSFTLNPDGKSVFISNLSNYQEGLQVIRIKDQKVLNAATNRSGKIFFSPDGSFVASAEWGVGGQRVNLIDPDNLKTFFSLRGYYYGIHDVALHPKAPFLMTGGLSGGGSSPMKMWDLEHGSLRDIPVRFNALVFDMEFSRDGKNLYAGKSDSAFAQFPSPSFYNPKQTRDHAGWVNAIAIKETGDKMATGSWDKFVKVRDMNSGKVLLDIGPHSNFIHDVSFHPTEDVVVTSTTDKIQFYDLNDGSEKAMLEPVGFPDMAFTPDGKSFVSGENNGLKIYSWPDLSLKQHYDKPEVINSALRDWHYSSVAVHPNGKWLAGGTLAGPVKVWDMEGNLKCRLEGHNSNVQSVQFTPSGNILASGAEDAKTILWDPAACKKIATLIAIDSTDFVIVTPDNYFMATKPGLKGVAFRLGDQVFPFEQFDLQYNRPDIVLERIGFANQQIIDAYHNAYRKRLKKAGFEEGQFNYEFHLPDIEFGSEALPAITETREFAFKIKASDSKYQLDRIQVYVNDVPAFGRKGISVRDKHTRSVEKEIKLDLAAGMNEIQVSCLNEKGVESLIETHRVQYKGGKAKPDLYLVTIGVSKYADERFNLKYASKDAGDLADLLEQGTEAFGTVNTKSLTDADVTLENVESMRSFLEQAGVDDVVIIFVAGHGLLDENLDYYFGTTNINFDNPQEGGLKYEALEALLDGLKSRKKILIMDTCHSGEVDKDEVELTTETKTEEGEISFRAAGAGVRKKEGLGLDNSFELMKFMFTDLKNGTGATVISSAGGAEYALEGAEWQNGVFTFSLLSGLKKSKADINGDQDIMLSELRKYIRLEVSKLTKGKQKPTFRAENLSSDFRVW